MKELTIEEKAKAYDELLIKLQKAKVDNNVCDERYCCVIDDIVPELKESEDELIRKKLIEAVKRDMVVGGTKDKKLAIAWLEKQGEHKHQYKSRPRYVGEAELLGANKQGEQILANSEKTCKDEQKPNPYSGTSFDYDGHTWGMCARDNGVELLLDGELKAFLSLEKSFIYPIHPQSELTPKSALEAAKEEKVDNANKVEPKFHKGDWVVTDKCDTVQIGAVNNGYYTLYNGMIFNMSYVDKCWHRWTIADAKDGDVLFHSDSASNGIFIFKELLKCGFSEEVICYCDYDSEDGFCLGDHHTCCWADAKILHPATKEQRDLLFQKMSDAGYAFDFDKKELKMIEQKPIIPKFKVGDIIKDTEDGEVFTIKTITKEKYIYTDGQFDWIKDQDIYELVEQKPTDKVEPKDYRSVDPHFFKPADKVEPKFKVGDVIRQTDKPEYTYTIREIKDGCYICDTCDFSTDNPLLELVKKQEWSNDDEQYLLICKNALSKYQVSDKWDAGIISRWLEERLKSIRSQSTWKPSDEQMKAIGHICDGNYNVDLDILDSIYRDFKKLREE